MGILAWIILGAIAGWIASVLLKTNSTQGMMVDIILGIAGAVVGGLIMNFFGQSGVTGVNLYSVVVSVLGAVALLSVSRLFYR